MHFFLEIKGFAPFRLGSFGKYGLLFDARPFPRSFQSNQLIWISFVQFM